MVRRVGRPEGLHYTGAAFNATATTCLILTVASINGE